MYSIVQIGQDARQRNETAQKMMIMTSEAA